MNVSTLISPPQRAVGLDAIQNRNGERTNEHRARLSALRTPGYKPFSVELVRAADTFIAGALLVSIFVGINAQNLPSGLADFLLVRVSVKNLLWLCGFMALWQLLFTGMGLYDTRMVWRRREEARRVLIASALGSLGVLLISLVGPSTTFPASLAGYYLVGVVAATLSVRFAMRELGIRTRSRSRKSVVIVGSGPRAWKLFQDLKAAPGAGYDFVGFVDSNDNVDVIEIERQLVGRLEDLEETLMRHPIDQVLIALPIRSCYAEIEDVIRTCERVGVESTYFADVFENAFARPTYDMTGGGVPAVALKVVQDDARLHVKRALDLGAAAAALVLLSPLMLAIATAIKLTSPGPIIFSQKRYGRNRRLFKMYKFRTMIPDAEALQASIEHLNEVGGPVFKIADDPRVTPIGRFLRRTSLDELPQLYNVLRGEMSVVGPRPLPTRDVRRFAEGSLMRRFSVIPGLTCLWQINGRSEIEFDEWLRLDLKYIDQWSLGLDLRILLATIPVVLRGTGAQ